MYLIKTLKNKNIRMNGVIYKPYYIGNLPKKFAFMYDEYEEKEGFTHWFNYKGFTYIEKQDKIW